MKEELVTDASLRQFLLGDVDDEERQRIESLFITDQLSRERVLAAEEELLDDYLEGSLSAGDKERFRSQFAYTPVEQRQLQIKQSIRDWALAEGKKSRTSIPHASTWSRWLTRFRLKPMLVMPVAAAAIVAIIVAILWVNRKMEIRNRQLSIEQEVARLNAPSNTGDVSVGISALTLRPLSLRALEPQTELLIQPNTKIAELRLVWNRNDSYSIYQAVLRRISDGDSLRIVDLRPETDGKAVRLKLPVHILNRGLYQLELIGIAADGRSSPAEEYQFEVVL